MSAVFFKPVESFRGATSPTWSVRPYGAITSFDESWNGTLEVYESDKATVPVLSSALIRAVDGAKMLGLFSDTDTNKLSPGKTYTVVFKYQSNSFGPLGSTKNIVKGSWSVR